MPIVSLGIRSAERRTRYRLIEDSSDVLMISTHGVLSIIEEFPPEL